MIISIIKAKINRLLLSLRILILIIFVETIYFLLTHTPNKCLIFWKQKLFFHFGSKISIHRYCCLSLSMWFISKKTKFDFYQNQRWYRDDGIKHNTNNRFYSNTHTLDEWTNVEISAIESLSSTWITFITIFLYWLFWW